jgi:Protein of unknown function (DUF2281)
MLPMRYNRCKAQANNRVAADEINISKLPEALQVEALHYIEYLASRSTNRPLPEVLEPPALTQKRNGFGILKGKVTIADDFDDPLEEFADYQ